MSVFAIIMKQTNFLESFEEKQHKITNTEVSVYKMPMSQKSSKVGAEIFGLVLKCLISLYSKSRLFSIL